MNSDGVCVAVVQAALAAGGEQNLVRVEDLVFDAARRGADVVVLPELFETAYFCSEMRAELFSLARPLDGHPTVDRFSRHAAELEIVLPVPFFERDGEDFYNSVAVVDADGRVLGCYRKSHLPDGPGYEEKFYFRPGPTAPTVWRTRHGAIGVGICWDQWFPEAARAMALDGADLLVYPSAIGSEPEHPAIDTRDPWRRVMVGHAVANAVVVAAANRVGEEDGQSFYGHSFITDGRGDVLAELGADAEGIAIASFDPKALREYREWFGLLRDRRPELYGRLSESS